MRMIDADRMLSELKPITYDMEQNAVTIADMSNIMRNWVMRQPTIPAPQWISVEDKWPQNGQWVVAYLYDGNIVCGVYYDAVGFTLDYCYEGQGEVSHWMPTPEPPEKRYKCRYADDNGVCSKLSGNGEIIYCVEGPCPYDFPEEVRDE